jgi:hypothetical protein
LPIGPFSLQRKYNRMPSTIKTQMIPTIATEVTTSGGMRLGLSVVLSSDGITRVDG